MDARDSDQDYEADDSDYDYTGEESNPEEVMEEEEEPEEEERCRFNWQDEEVDQLDRDLSCEDWQYCERDSHLLARRLEPPQVYAPDRGPPLLDFLFVLTAFFAAAFAAFYTILSETGAPR